MAHMLVWAMPHGIWARPMPCYVAPRLGYAMPHGRLLGLTMPYGS